MSPLNHLHDLQRKSPAASLAGKKGGRALWDGRLCCPLAPGQDRQGLENLLASAAVPLEETPQDVCHERLAGAAQLISTPVSSER